MRVIAFITEAPAAPDAGALGRTDFIAALL
jgi:hypothetical protein